MRRRELLFGAAAAGAQTGRKPNVILILTDDQGWWDLGIHGNPHVETPVLDQLARDSVRFSHFYASPVCAPTRASLMTGRHYLRTGIYNTRFGGDTMDPAEVTLAEVLRGHGYRTALFGKWHLGHYSNVHPNQRGFDEYLGFPQGHIERYFHPDQLNHNGRPVEARGHVSEVFTDSAVSFVKANRARPFFLYLAFNVPHEPSFVDDSYTQRFLDKGVPLRDAKVYGMIRHCDEQIGRLLKTVDEAGLREDTIVIFLTDNGGVSRHFRAGLRGNKATAYEGGVRVPFFARWPGRFPAGAVVEAAAAHIDVLPTLCELTGAPLPERKLDGKSIARLMREGRGEPPHDFLYHIWDRHRPGMRSNWSIHGRRFKLVKNELFDLRADPGEKTDLAAKHPEEAAALRREFERWLKEVNRGAGVRAGGGRDRRAGGSACRSGGKLGSGARGGQLHLHRIRLGFDRWLAQTRRLGRVEARRGGGGTLPGGIELWLLAGGCGWPLPDRPGRREDRGARGVHFEPECV
ncbi:MAG: arylsulfatase [Acidobacteria bacterium]|nr:arylsulfatase [Acidobacteriota bacterium]